MCGRYTLSIPLSNLIDTFQVEPPTFDYLPRYNIAPTQEVPVVAEDDRSRRMGLLRWGLVPSWAKDPGIGSRLINARSETASSKPAFRSAFSRRRCLVPADGFFEWRREGGESGGKGAKTPFWIHLEGGEAMGFAGLWERWEGEGEAALHTFTILTTEAVDAIRPIHPRMPVILPRESWDPWLASDTDPERLQALMVPFRSAPLLAHPVSSLVNSPRNDDPACIDPVV